MNIHPRENTTTDKKLNGSGEVKLNLDLSDMVDEERIQPIMDEFYKQTGISAGLIDLDGKVLVATDWQDICASFHRVHPETKKHCIESDTELAKKAKGSWFRTYKCKNNLRDVAIPVIVESQYMGNVFIGQFFYEDESVDTELFRTQAKKYGFDEAKYLQALEKVPRISSEQLESVMNFYVKLADLISTMGRQNAILRKSLRVQEQATERETEMRKQLKDTSLLFQSTLDSLSAHICVLDEQGYIKMVNKSWLNFGLENGANSKSIGLGVNYIKICSQVGESADERVDTNSDCVSFDVKNSARNQALEFLQGIYSVMYGDSDYFEMEYSCHSPKEKLWFLGRVTPHEGYKQSSLKRGVVIAHEDITERKLAGEQIRYLSYHDNLTGLYNRAYLEERIHVIERTDQFPIGLILADLNGLKLINDTYGHSIGDEQLIKTANILNRAVRNQDIVARWGGDEFIILMPDTTEKNARKVSAAINNICSLTEKDEIPVSITMGVSAKMSSSEGISDILQQAEEEMYKNKLIESKSAKSNILKALLNTLGAKSYETEEHAWRMQDMAFKIGDKIGLSEVELDRLILLVSMHDIGKITIPEYILTKPGQLTEQEWELIKKHPETGYWIARSTEEFSHIAEEILSHHEWWDGSGYPRELIGEEIPLLARITAIVDAYDVMVHGRPYKKAFTQQEAVQEIQNCAGTQFDTELVRIFVTVLKEQYEYVEIEENDNM